MTTNPQKIAFGEMRESGVRDVLIYCRDHRRSHQPVATATDRLSPLFLERVSAPDHGPLTAFFGPSILKVAPAVVWLALGGFPLSSCWCWLVIGLVAR
jgi:hypothetical protein